MSDFKILLGMEMDKNSLSVITKELQNLNKNMGGLKISVDDKAMQRLQNSLKEINSSIQKLATDSTSVGAGLGTSMDKATKSARTYKGVVTEVFEAYKNGSISGAKAVEQMSSAIMKTDGTLKSSMKDVFNEQEIQGFIGLLDSVKGRVSEIKPIGELINTKSISVIKNDMGELVKVTDTYKDRMGQVQTITSLVNKSTGDLVATQQTITTNEGKRVDVIETQRQALVKMQEAYKTMNQYAMSGIKSGSFTNADNGQITALNNLKKALAEIEKLNQDGVIIEKSKINVINEQLAKVNSLQQAKKAEIQEEQRLATVRETATNKQLADIAKLQTTMMKATTQYGGVANADSKQALEEQIQALQKLDPLTDEYFKGLVDTRSALATFVAETRQANSEMKLQAQNVNSLANAQASLDKVTTKYGSFADSNVTSGIQTSITKLKEMAEAGVDVKAKVQEVTREIVKLGEQSKTSASLDKYKTDMGAKLEGLKQQFQANLLPTQQITDAQRKLSSLSATEGDLIKKTQQMDGVYKGLQNTLKATSGTAKGVGTSFKSMLQMATGIYGISSAFMYGRQAITSLISESTALSDAMISLSRVTNETDATYNQFADNAFKVANRIGGSAKELVNSATEFSKLGFSFAEAGQLAESASKYATTGWLEMGEATDALSASYTVFSDTFDEAIGKVVDATTIIDLYNATGNKMAIDSKGVGEAMKASANSLSSANNSLSESVALIATANKTVQDSSKVGNALRTISMRLRGLNEETGELIPKMQEIIQAGTNGKVDIMNGDEFKSTYDIMLEVSEVWDELTDKQRAYLGEQIAGKNRAEVFMALMGNAEDLTYAMEVAQGSIGSVDAEMEVVMNTFEKRVEVMKNAWSELATTTVNSDFVKGLVDATTGIIKLMDACGGLIPVLASLGAGFGVFKLATVALEAGATATGMMSLAGAMKAYTAETLLATTATQSLNMAKLGLAGIAVGGILALGAGIKYLGETAERAEQHILDLNEAVNAQSAKTANVTALANEYKNLAEKTSLSTEEQSRYTQVQNELKASYPELLGYYDEENNFVIAQTDSVTDLIAVEKERLALMQTDRLDAYNDRMKTAIANYDTQREVIQRSNEEMEKNLRYRELLAKTDLNPEETRELKQLELGLHIVVNPTELEASLRQAQSELDEMQKYINLTVTANAVFGEMSDEEKQKITSAISKLTDEQIRQSAQGLSEGIFTAEEFIDKLYELGLVAQDTGKKMKDNLNVEDTTLSSLGVVAEQVASDMDILEVALNELNATNDISEATMKKLITAYPQLATQIKDTTSAYGALNQKLAENEFSTATDNMATLVGIQEDLIAGNGLTASSFQKLSSTFPELLAYMNDEASLADAIANKMVDLQNTQAEAYRQMLLNSETYYNANIKGNAEMTNSLNSQLTDLFNSYGVMYQGDASNWASLAKGKAKCEEDLINGLNKAWGNHFNSLGSAFNSISNKMSASFSPINDMYNKQNQIMSDFANGSAWGGNNGANSVLTKTQSEFNQYMSQVKQQQQAMKDLAGIFDGIEFKPISIDAGGIKVGGTKAGGGSGSGSSSKAKEEAKKASAYIKSLYQSMVDDVLEGGNAVENEIKFTNARLENAIRLGDVEKQNEYNDSLEQLFKQQRDEQAKMAKELDKYLAEMKTTLTNTGLFKGKEMDSLTKLDLDKIVNDLDKAINKASDSQKDALEKQKALVEDVGDVYLSTMKDRMDLSTEWWNLEEERAEQQFKNILRNTDRLRKELEQKSIILDIKTSLISDKDMDGQISGIEDSWRNTMLQQKNVQNAIDKLKAQGYNNESEEVQNLQDEWLDLEKERLSAIRQRAEARMKVEQEAHDKEMENKKAEIALEKDKMDATIDAIEAGMDKQEDLLELTIKMLEKELKLKKEMLSDAKDDKLDLLEEEYNAEKELYEDKMDLLDKEAKARKKALTDEKDEKDFNDDVAKKQLAIAKIQSQITDLSLDDSRSAVAQRKELEQELAELQKDLADTLYDRDIELQEDAIDTELDMQKDKFKTQLEKIEKQYKEEKKLIEDKYEEEVKLLDEKLDQEGVLREEALKLIEGKTSAFYDRLSHYATTYSDMTKVEFVDLWETAYDSMDKYNNGIYNVVDSLQNMTNTIQDLKAEMEELDRLSSSLDNSNKPSDDYHDYLEDFDDSDDDDYDFNENRWESQQKEPEKPKPSTSTNTNTSPQYTDQERQQRYLHSLMLEAKADGNTQLINWIKAERKRWGLNPDTGAIETVRHEGLLMGRIGDNKKASERILKATEDEWVLTGKQYDTLDKNLQTVNSRATTGNNEPQSINVVCDFKGATINKDTLPDLQKLINTAIPKALNDVLYKKAIR